METWENNTKRGTVEILLEYNCRKAIESVATTIKSAEERLEFCALILPKISVQKDWQGVKRRVELWLKKKNQAFDEIKTTLMALAAHLKNTKLTKSQDEMKSIAGKILQDKQDVLFVQPNQTIDRATKKSISKCSICCQSRNLRACEKCASAFHVKCHRGQTQCRECLAGNTLNDIVYIPNKRKWRPAIVISDSQVPENVFNKGLRDSRYVFVYSLGENAYRQVPAANCLTFKIDNALRNAIVKQDDDTLENEMKTAQALDEGFAWIRPEPICDAKFQINRIDRVTQFATLCAHATHAAHAGPGFQWTFGVYNFWQGSGVPRNDMNSRIVNDIQHHILNDDIHINLNENKMHQRFDKGKMISFLFNSESNLNCFHFISHILAIFFETFGKLFQFFLQFCIV